MKRTEPLHISEILRRMVAATGLRPDLMRHSIESMWPRIVGPNIAAYTGRIFVSGRTLNVYITSAALKEELGYARADLVDKLNEAVGESVIDDIIIK